MTDCLRSFYLKQSRGFAGVATLALVLVRSCCVIVKSIELVELTGMHKAGCSRETRLVLHVPSSP